MAEEKKDGWCGASAMSFLGLQINHYASGTSLNCLGLGRFVFATNEHFRKSNKLSKSGEGGDGDVGGNKENAGLVNDCNFGETARIGARLVGLCSVRSREG